MFFSLAYSGSFTVSRFDFPLSVQHFPVPCPLLSPVQHHSLPALNSCFPELFSELFPCPMSSLVPFPFPFYSPSPFNLFPSFFAVPLSHFPHRCTTLFAHSLSRSPSSNNPHLRRIGLPPLIPLGDPVHCS